MISANAMNQAAVLKELYKSDIDVLENMVYKENPLYALLPKNEAKDSLGGKYLPLPIQYGNPGGRSADFSSAQTYANAPLNASFFIAPTRNYQEIYLDNLFMEQSATDAESFVNGVKQSVDSSFRNIGNDIAFKVFADGTGIRGYIGAVSNSGLVYTITLANSASVVQFEDNMTLTSAGVTTSASGMTVTAITSVSATTLSVTSVDRINGIVVGTLSATDSSSQWVVGAGLSAAGDSVVGTVTFSASGSSMLNLCGLAAWIPYENPGVNDSFWGVNRSADPTRLGGLRFNATAFSIEEGMIAALALANREGAKPDLIVMNFASYQALVNQLSGKVNYTRAEHDEVEVGFDGIMFQSAYGSIMVLADRSCPPNTAYALTMSSWQLRSLGRYPKINTYGLEGLEGLRVSNQDALEIRIVGYGNLTCNAPGRNLVILLSA